MIQHRRALVGLAWIVGALSLVGCASPAPQEASPSPLSSNQESWAGSINVTDADTCLAMGDVLSVIVNADAALSEGRMDSWEHGSWYRVSTILLSKVPVRGEGPVSEAVMAFQELNPPAALASYEGMDIGSRDSAAGWESIRQACVDAGFEITTVRFTGG